MQTAPEEFVDAYNERDWERMRGTLAEGCSYEEIGRPRHNSEGIEDVIRVFQGWAKAVPEARVELVGSAGEGDAVALEAEIKGALKGPFGDFSSSGTPPAARVALFFKL